MPTFIYDAVQRDGKRVRGELEAETKVEACEKLDVKKLQPLSLHLKGAASLGIDKLTSSPAKKMGRLSRAQIILFTEEISDLLEAGLQLEPALKVMEQRQDHSSLKLVAAALRQQIREGRNFSEALRLVSSSFGELYCNLVAAGETSGALPQILRRQVAYLVLIQELQERIKSALIYPSIIFGAGIALLFLFMAYLVPQLTVLFTKTGKDLPVATRLLINVSDFTANYWWAILMAAALAIGSFLRYIKSPTGRAWWDRVQFGIPIVGEILKARFCAQFIQTMATLIHNGIPLLQALRLVKSATVNVYLQDLLFQVTEAVGEGSSLSKALSRSHYFPPLMLDMVTVGEQTGDLSFALEKAAQRYDKELSVRIQRLTTLIEPVIIIAMALLVGMVAYSMITGIFQGISGLRTKL